MVMTIIWHCDCVLMDYLIMYCYVSYVSEYVMNATITPVMLHINVLLEINKNK